MTDQDVIDLTNSFTLANHSAMANVIIEINDSLNESNVSQQSAVPFEDLGVVEVSSDLTSEASQACSVLAVRHRKRRKHAKKKVEQTCQPKSEANEIRERSPIGTHLGDCPICLERFGINRLASTKCGHVFCEQCIIRALHTESKCPTCRRALRGKSSYHPLFLSRD